MAADAGFLQAQVTIPGESHEYVAGEQQENGLKGRHYFNE